MRSSGTLRTAKAGTKVQTQTQPDPRMITDSSARFFSPLNHWTSRPNTWLMMPICGLSISVKINAATDMETAMGNAKRQLIKTRRVFAFSVGCHGHKNARVDGCRNLDQCIEKGVLMDWKKAVH